MGPGTQCAKGLGLLLLSAVVTHWSPLGMEVEARRSGRQKKFKSLGRMNRRKRRDFLVLQCGYVGVQDERPERPHCSSGLSGMQEIGLISLDSCATSWLCQLNFSYHLSNHERWANRDCPQKLQEPGNLPTRRQLGTKRTNPLRPITSFSHPHN